MIITYDIHCFERELKAVFPDELKEHEKEIIQVLDDAYYEWHHPEDIEDEEERAYVNDSCCEEHMIYRLSWVFDQYEKWASEYYGDDPEEMEDEVYWTINPLKEVIVNE